MKRKHVVYSLIAIIGLIASVSAYFLSPKTVEIITVEQRDMPVHISNEANVVALNKVNVETYLSGQVSAYTVKVGDDVKAGDILAVIDTSHQKQQLASLFEQLEQAQAQPPVEEWKQEPAPGVVTEEDVARARYMMDVGVITEKEFNIIEARAKNGGGNTFTKSYRSSGTVDTSGLRASIAQLQGQIADSEIIAPMDGRVAAIYDEDRKIAIAGKPIMLLQQSSPVVASLTIPQSFALKLNDPDTKATLKVSLQVESELVPGELTYVDTNAPLGTPSVLIKALFNNPRDIIKPGEFYTLIIDSSATAPVLTLPKSVIRNNGDGHYVYVVTEDQTIDLRMVEIGKEVNGYVPIINGILKGERIVSTKGKFALGETVRVR